MHSFGVHYLVLLHALISSLSPRELDQYHSEGIDIRTLAEFALADEFWWRV